MSSGVRWARKEGGEKELGVRRVFLGREGTPRQGPNRHLPSSKTADENDPDGAAAPPRQDPVPSIDAPSAELFLDGLRPRRAHLRFTRHLHLTDFALGGAIFFRTRAHPKKLERHGVSLVDLREDGKP